MPSYTDEIKQMMDVAVYDENTKRRGLTITGFSVESVTLTDMQPLSESDISSMYGIDLNDVTAFAGEIDSTGLRTDEFLIIEAKNNESADRILTKMKARQTQRMNEAKNYNPEGYATVQKSPVAKKGNYVYLFFSEDADTMVNILNENVK